MSSRRLFLGVTGWTAASWSQVPGANDRLRVGLLGSGGRGTSVTSRAKEFGNVDVVALADINKVRLEQARQQLSPNAALFGDFRALLERKDIDAVIIGSPDHWHVPMLTAAVQAGKDAYVEKPLTRMLEEGPGIIQAVKASGRIVQVGYQQRSYPHFQAAREVIRTSKIGKVTLVQSWWNQNYATRLTPPAIDASQIEWKQFLGSAPPRAFDPWRYSQWRFFWDYGGGTMTDLYSHWIDSIHWVMDDWVPLTAQGSGAKHIVTHWEAPDTVTASFKYPKEWVSSYTSTMVTRLDDGGILFRGTGGSLRLDRTGFELRTDATSLAKGTSSPPPDLAEKSQRDGTIDHVLNWIECVKSRNPPNSTVTDAVAAANAAHFGNEAIRTGKLLTLPPSQAEFRPLFDGVSLKGWVEDTPGIWKVREGMIIGSSSPAGLKWNDFLRSAELFGDFELQLEFRLVSGIGNSGVQFRSEPVPTSHEVAGYQADVGQQQYWGALYDESRRKKVLIQPDPAMIENLDRSGWHTYVIRADGNHITLTLDGIRTVDYTEESAGLLKRGFLALQVHSGPPTEVHFKNLRIREL